MSLWLGTRISDSSAISADQFTAQFGQFRGLFGDRFRHSVAISMRESLVMAQPHFGPRWVQTLMTVGIGAEEGWIHEGKAK